MERLTERTKAGQAYYKKCFGEPCNGRIEKDCPLCNFHTGTVCERLAAYEDLVVSPEQLHEVSKLYLEKCEEINRLRAELAEYNSAEEKGLLLRLPCAIGDIIWDNDFGEPYPYEIIHFTYEQNDGCSTSVKDTEFVYYFKDSSGGITGRFVASNIGKTVFLTKEEAEQALKQMGE